MLAVVYEISIASSSRSNNSYPILTDLRLDSSVVWASDSGSINYGSNIFRYWLGAISADGSYP